MKPSDIHIGATYKTKGTTGHVIRRVVSFDRNCVHCELFRAGIYEAKNSMTMDEFLSRQRPIESPLDCRELLAAKARVAELENVERLRMEYVACPHHVDDAAKNAWTSAREAAFKGVL